MTKVMTYTAPYGESINLTPVQEAAFKRAGFWPRDNRGEEYRYKEECCGAPTWSNGEVGELWPETRHFLPYEP